MTDKDYKMQIDGELVSFAKLKKAYRFWREYHFDVGDTECPICGSVLWERGLFVCERCGRLLPVCEESEYTNYVCKDCDEVYQVQKQYEEAVNAKIDYMRGK